MLSSHLAGLAAIAVVAAAWTGVQRAWRRSFPDPCGDPDALAGRIGCHADDCAHRCDRRRARTASIEEDGS